MALTSEQIDAVARRASRKIFADKTATVDLSAFQAGVGAWAAMVEGSKATFINALPESLQALDPADRFIIMSELLIEMGLI